jgi:hypothetical protein
MRLSGFTNKLNASGNDVHMEIPISFSSIIWSRQYASFRTVLENTRHQRIGSFGGGSYRAARKRRAKRLKE